MNSGNAEAYRGVDIRVEDSLEGLEIAAHSKRVMTRSAVLEGGRY